MGTLAWIILAIGIGAFAVRNFIGIGIPSMPRPGTGGGGGGDPGIIVSAPTLTRTTGATTYPPQFDVGLPPEALVGDILVLSRSASALITSPTDVSVTIDAALLLAGTANFNLSTVLSGSVFFRAHIMRGAYRVSAYSPVRNVGDVTAPIISAPASSSSAENATFAGTCTTDEYATLTITGNDAAKFEVTSAPGTSHTFRFVGGVQPDYEIPTDANTDNVYEYTLNAVDPAGNPATPVARTVTITDVFEYAPMTFSPLPANKNSNVSLSPDKKTASGTDTVERAEVRTNQNRTGKRYYEFTVSSLEGALLLIGVASDGYTDYATLDGSDPTATAYGVALAWLDNYSQIQPKSNAAATNVNTLTVNDYTTWGSKVWQMAVDETARLVWFGLDNTWANGDPAAGTGGTALPATGSLFVFCTLSEQNAITLRTTSAEYTKTKPSGWLDGDD